jgi:hypothetical protein
MIPSKAICATAIIMAFLASSFLIPAPLTDFSGNWMVNKSKTQFGNAPEWILPKWFSVEQKQNAISIERTQADDSMKQRSFKESLSFDGTESTSETYKHAKIMSILKWNEDGKTFSLSAHSLDENNKAGASYSEVWSLEDNGKTLVIDRDVTQANGYKYNIKAFYDLIND